MYSKECALTAGCYNNTSIFETTYILDRLMHLLILTFSAMRYFPNVLLNLERILKTHIMRL